ncbi:MAG: RNA polymerase sigma factor [Proteobacteria bacterium]|nr:RNA polymerase sigma factor [Pseudomonadota bacterium]
MRHQQDIDLVRQVLGKNKAAFETFFETYFARLFRFCSTRIDDEGAVEDIVQETLIKALKSLHGYRGEAALFSWLCQICRHEISNHYRENGRNAPPGVSLDDSPEVRSALESLASEEATDALQQRTIERLVQLTLDHLPDRYAKVLEWKYVEGLSVDEISEQLGEGRIAVQSVLARARTAFRKAFSDLNLELSVSK